MSFNIENAQHCLTIYAKEILMLPFKKIIKNTPLIFIDVIVANQVGQILIGKRNNRPAQ